MSTAAAFYRSFLRDRIAPALRSLGLSGAGNTFTLPDESTWAIVGFQSDGRLSGLGIPNFTINLTRADKAGWDRKRREQPWYPAVPGAGSMEPAECIRIGALVPVKATLSDRWWLLDDGIDHPLEHPALGGLMVDLYGPPMPPAEAARQVTEAVRDHAIPWLMGEPRVTLTNAD